MLLLFNDVELGFDTFSAHMLLSGSEGLELVSVAERVPHRCISVKDVLHTLILDLHRLLLRNFQSPVLILIIFPRNDLRFGQQSLDNLQAKFELLHVSLEPLSEKVAEILVLRMVEVERRENEVGQLPVRVAQVLVIAFSVHTVSDSLLLLDLAYYIGDINLMLLIVGLQV